MAALCLSASPNPNSNSNAASPHAAVLSLPNLQRMQKDPVVTAAAGGASAGLTYTSYGQDRDQNLLSAYLPYRLREGSRDIRDDISEGAPSIAESQASTVNLQISSPFSDSTSLASMPSVRGGNYITRLNASLKEMAAGVEAESLPPSERAARATTPSRSQAQVLTQTRMQAHANAQVETLKCQIQYLQEEGQSRMQLQVHGENQHEHTISPEDEERDFLQPTCGAPALVPAAAISKILSQVDPTPPIPSITAAEFNKAIVSATSTAAAPSTDTAISSNVRRSNSIMSHNASQDSIGTARSAFLDNTSVYSAQSSVLSTQLDGSNGYGGNSLRVEPGKKKMTVLRRLKKTTSAVMRGVGLAPAPIKISKTTTAQRAVTAAGAGKLAVSSVGATDVPVPVLAAIPASVAAPAFKLFESPKQGDRQLSKIPVLAHEAPTW